jgi:hypothetical protein
MKNRTLFLIIFFLPFFKSRANCTLNVTSPYATVTNVVWHANGTCDVTVSFSFSVLLNTGSRFMGMHITSPLLYNTPTQISPEAAGGPKTYTITSFTGIRFNNINCMALQANGIMASFWVSTNDPALGNEDLCESAGTKFTIFNGAVLPVKLKDFLAGEENGRASLSWTTVNETNVKEFVVQREIDNGGFQNMATAAARGTGSNSNQEITYKVTLAETLDRGNAYFYRLQITDIYGNTYYSEIKTLRGKNAAFTITLYPNPANCQTSLILPYNAGKVNISLVDLSGRVVLDLRNPDNRSISVAGLKSGIYFVRVSFLNNNKSVYEKLMVTN